MGTHCKNGHEYTPDDFDTRGHRYCQICKRTASREFYKKSKPNIEKNRRYRVLVKKIEELVQNNPNIIIQPWKAIGLKFFKASDLKKIDIGSCYLAEIRAAQQSGIKAPQLNSDQADFGRRLSA